MRPEQRVADSRTEFADVAANVQTQDLEGNPPSKGIAVGVKSRRGQADQAIAGNDVPPIDDGRPRDDTYDEAGHVILAGRVEARHLRRLASKECAAVLDACPGDAGHDLFDDVR